MLFGSGAAEADEAARIKTATDDARTKFVGWCIEPSLTESLMTKSIILLNQRKTAPLASFSIRPAKRGRTKLPAGAAVYKRPQIKKVCLYR